MNDELKELAPMGEIGLSDHDMRRYTAAEIRAKVNDLNALLEVAGRLGLQVQMNDFPVRTHGAMHMSQLSVRVVREEEL